MHLLMLFVGAGAPSHAGGYYYANSVMILLQWVHISHVKKKNHFSPNGKIKLKKKKNHTVHLTFKEYYKEISTMFSLKLGPMIYIKCFNTYILGGDNFTPKGAKFCF